MTIANERQEGKWLMPAAFDQESFERRVAWHGMASVNPGALRPDEASIRCLLGMGSDSGHVSDEYSPRVKCIIEGEERWVPADELSSRRRVCVNTLNDAAASGRKDVG